MKYYKRDIIERESAVYFGFREKFYVYSPFYRNGNQKQTNIIIHVVEKNKKS